MKFDKIYLIGGPGSGKSYAAKKLSKLLKIARFELDEIYWHKKDQNFSLKTPEKVRDQKLKEILKRKKWIIEGVFSSWTKKCFQDADWIIILRPGKYLRASRILKRSLHSCLRIGNRKSESLKGLKEFLKWNHGWDTVDIIKVEKRLKRYKKKILYFKKADHAISHILKNK